MTEGLSKDHQEWLERQAPIDDYYDRDPIYPQTDSDKIDADSARARVTPGDTASEASEGYSTPSIQRAKRMVRNLGKNIGVYTNYRPISASEFVRNRSQRFREAMGAAATRGMKDA